MPHWQSGVGAVEKSPMATFFRTSHLLMALGLGAALTAAGCSTYGGRGAARAPNVAYEALKAGYDSSTAGHGVESAPIADALADTV